MDKFFLAEDTWSQRRVDYAKKIRMDFNIDELQKGCIIFGAAVLGLKIVEGLRKINIPVIAFVDNDMSKHGGMLDCISIRSPEILKDYDVPIVIASKYIKEIDAQLESMKKDKRIPHYVLSLIYPEVFSNDLYRGAFEKIQGEWISVKAAYELLADEASRDLYWELINFRHTLRPSDLPTPQKDQYFPAEFWTPHESEVFVDVGAYDGDTLKEYLWRSRGVFEKYVAIEPDAANYHKLLSSIPLEYKKKVVTINAAAGISQARHVFFKTGGLDSRLISEELEDIAVNSYDVVETIALDEILEGKPVHTIKIDVEGWEPYVLAGAEQTIREKRPRLAVCVYHRPEHLWRLPMQIASYNPEYKFLLKHHETEIYGSVLYCIPGGDRG